MQLIDKNVPLASEKAEDHFNKAIGVAIKAEEYLEQANEALEFLAIASKLRALCPTPKA